MRMFVIAALACVALTGAAFADQCPGNPDALGVARTIVVDPSEHTRIGTMQYTESLPLADKEVVLSFDDGPLPPYTNRVLETLAAECVKATFFIVGRQARAYPDMVRRVYNEGHTVASHSQNHPRIFTTLPMDRAQQEIDGGIAAAAAALGDPALVAPFFRFPGLGRSEAIENYLASRRIMAWSADFPADDWTHISAQQVMARALERIERKGKGVLLLHDIQPATVLALPALLRELKARGYRIVHVIPAGPARPKTVTEPTQWVMRTPPKVWPQVVMTFPPPQLPIASPETFGWPNLFQFRSFMPPRPARVKVASATPGNAAIRVQPNWPTAVALAPPRPPALPVPSLLSFGYGAPTPRALRMTLPQPGEFIARATAARQPLPTARYPIFWPHPMSGVPQTN